MTDNWDCKTLTARVSDFKALQRFAGGSPNSAEVAAYAAGFPPALETGACLVLGMTPELRKLAASRSNSFVTVERNPDAIELYRDWLNTDMQRKERIISAEWLTLGTLDLPEAPCAAVIGDGIFGNLPNLTAHRALLRQITSRLHSEGRFITRKALATTLSQEEASTPDMLIRQYRQHEIDEAEFGFGMRLRAFLDTCYNAVTYELDNRTIFQQCSNLHRSQQLTDQEYTIVKRYYYGGTNCILPQEVWEQTLKECGFSFRIHRLKGKTWYAYYPVYECWRSL